MGSATETVLERVERYVWGGMEYGAGVAVCAFVLVVVFFGVFVLRPHGDGGCNEMGGARRWFRGRRSGEAGSADVGGASGVDGTIEKEEKAEMVEFEEVRVRAR